MSVPEIYLEARKVPEPSDPLRGLSIIQRARKKKRPAAALSRAALAFLILILIILFSGISYYVVTTRYSNTLSSSNSSSSSSPLILYSADAYVAESSALEAAFTNATGTQMAPPKAAGSFLLAQEIAQGNPVSVFVSVSKAAVQTSMLKNASSGWAVAFASDQMGIAYSNATVQSPESSAAAAQVIDAYQTAVSTNTTESWFEFFSDITSGKVKVGISNPNADPAGLRGWLVLEAAGYVYANNDSNYFVNRILSNAGNVTGTSAADLIAPLQAGQIQFLFIYKSDIAYQKLNLLQLKNGVNLGNPSYNNFYSKFKYTTSSGTQSGASIVLWITVPKDSTDYSKSVEFVAFVIENSTSVLKPFGLTIFATPKLYNDTSVPDTLQQLVNQGQLQPAGAL